MPMKYLMGMPQMVSVVGAIHGALFILYLLALLLAWMEQRWPFVTLVLGVIASSVPFGPFLFDAYLEKQPRK